MRGQPLSSPALLPGWRGSLYWTLAPVYGGVGHSLPCRVHRAARRQDIGGPAIRRLYHSTWVGFGVRVFSHNLTDGSSSAKHIHQMTGEWGGGSHLSDTKLLDCRYDQIFWLFLEQFVLIKSLYSRHIAWLTRQLQTLPLFSTRAWVQRVAPRTIF